jgi:CHAD domain-containing protein
VSDDEYRAENRLLRDTALGLAGSRDHTVALRTMEQLGRKSESAKARKALRKARRAIERSGVDAGECGGGLVTEEATRAAIEALGESCRRFGLIEARATGWAVMEGGLYHTYRRARNRFSRWRKTSDPAQGHDCRKYAKYLLFQIELLEDMDSARIGKLRAEFTKLETRLGKLNDLVTLDGMLERERAEGRISPEVHKIVRRLARRKAKKLGKAGRRTGGKLLRPPAERFVKGIEEDWREWRGLDEAR